MTLKGKGREKRKEVRTRHFRVIVAEREGKKGRRTKREQAGGELLRQTIGHVEVGSRDGDGILDRPRQTHRMDWSPLLLLLLLRHAHSMKSPLASRPPWEGAERERRERQAVKSPPVPVPLAAVDHSPSPP